MTLFQTKIHVNQEEIAQILKQHWGITLGKLLQTSQNSTYEGFRSNNQAPDERFAVRVSPDPENKNHQKIRDQIFFVNYLVSHKLNYICSFVKKTSQANEDDFAYFGDKFSVVVISWVNGEHLPFPEFEWMKNQKVVFAWGKFFAEMHKLSKLFQKEHSEVAQRIQTWRQIHNEILNDVKLDQLDEKDVDNPEHYGVLHGDLNCSNFFFDKTNGVMNVFDTDQVQMGFYLWDVSRAIFTSYMLQNAGMPNSGEPVPQANSKQFSQWIVEGYESVTGKGTVDRERLERMVLLNRHFYVKFCSQAVQQGSIPEDMRGFVEYIAKHLAKSS